MLSICFVYVLYMVSIWWRYGGDMVEIWDNIAAQRANIAEGSPKDHGVIMLKTSILCILYGVLYIDVIFSMLLLPQRRQEEGEKKGQRMWE